jgi:hypothetical protein
MLNFTILSLVHPTELPSFTYLENVFKLLYKRKYCVAESALNLIIFGICDLHKHPDTTLTAFFLPIDWSITIFSFLGVSNRHCANYCCLLLICSSASSVLLLMLSAIN